MAEYGKVYKKIWNNGRFQKLSEKAKFLYLYMITSPHCSVFGLFRLPIGYISGDLSWQPKTVLRYLRELQSASFLLWEQKSCLVIISSWLDHNPITSENQLKKGLAELSEIPKNLDFLSKLKEMARIHKCEYHKIIVKEIEESYLSSSLNHSYSEAEAVTGTEYILPENSGNFKRVYKKNKRQPTKKDTGVGSGNISPNGDSPISDNKKIIQYHAEKYKEEYEEEPHIVWGRDSASAKRLLDQHSLEQIKKKIDALFKSSDDWVKKNDKTLAGFESVYSRLVTQKPKTPDYSRPPGAR